MIDSFYYIDKSFKQKCSLAVYCKFCDFEYRKIIKHVNSRGLSLKLAID